MQYDFGHYLRTYKRPILVWSSIVLACVLVISLAVWQQSIETRRGKIAVEIRTAPSDAAVEIAGVKYGQGEQYLAPGEYTAHISKEGFADATQQLRVNHHSQPAVIAGLSPKSEEAKAWYERSRHEYAKIEQLSLAQAHKYGEAFQERWPIVTSLPLRDPYFTIGYKNVDDRDIILTIKATSPRYRELALDELRVKGYEPTDYKIEFSGFTNPLEEENQ